MPLNHLGQLIGFVVLARSRAQFKLDREVYDLLRIVGREVASQVAEQRATQVLTDTRQLQEYSQRFAFVIHDIKNVSGQLSMLLTNAEVHADNPEFQRDMLATVRAFRRQDHPAADPAAGAGTRARTDHDGAVERLTELAAGYLRTRRITVSVDHDGRSAGVAIDPGTFDAVVPHLLNNAIEASEGGAGAGFAFVMRR